MKIYVVYGYNYSEVGDILYCGVDFEYVKTLISRIEGEMFGTNYHVYVEIWEDGKFIDRRFNWCLEE